MTHGQSDDIPDVAKAIVVEGPARISTLESALLALKSDDGWSIMLSQKQAEALILDRLLMIAKIEKLNNEIVNLRYEDKP